MLNQHDEALLVALRKGRHLKANPGDPQIILPQTFPAIEESEILASFRRVTGAGLAKRVPDSARPGATLLRLTDEGMAHADQLIEAARPRTWREKVAALPIGKGVWDVFKIGLGFILGVIANQLTGS